VTIFTTIITGFLVFILGQIFLKWIIEPIQDLRKVISEVIFYFANLYATIQNAKTVDRSVAIDAGKQLEMLGARLLSSQELIPFYKKIRKIISLPTSENILRASKKLSLISKSMFGDENDKHDRLDIYIIDVCQALNIANPIHDMMTREELIKNVEELRKIRNT
jgi:hypothetical protein